MIDEQTGRKKKNKTRSKTEANLPGSAEEQAEQPGTR